MRKNFVAQAVSMIQAVRLSQSEGCGSHGWCVGCCVYTCTMSACMSVLRAEYDVDVNIEARRMFCVFHRSRVDQKGWGEVCGTAYRAVQQERIDVNDLLNTLADIREKTRDILKVRLSTHVYP